MPPPLELGAGRLSGCRDGFYLWPAGYACFPGEDSKVVMITALAVLVVAIVVTIGSVAWSISRCSKCAKEHCGPTALQQTAKEANATEDKIVDICEKKLCEMYPWRCKNGIVIPIKHKEEREANPPLYEDVSDAPEVVTEPNYTEPTHEPEYDEPTTELGSENDQVTADSSQAAELRAPGKMEVRWKFRVRVRGGAGRGYYGPWLGPWLGALNATDRRRC